MQDQSTTGKDAVRVSHNISSSKIKTLTTRQMFQCSNSCRVEGIELGDERTICKRATTLYGESPLSNREADRSQLVQLDFDNIQTQLDGLDQTFLKEIPLAAGVFQLSDKEQISLFGDVHVNHSDDDESTVDTTVSNSSDTASDNEESSLNQSSDEESIKVISQTGVQNSKSCHFDNRCMYAHRLPDSIFDSHQQFDTKETDETKKKIRKAALQAKIRKQNFINAELLKKLRVNTRKKDDLETEIHESNFDQAKYDEAHHLTSLQTADIQTKGNTYRKITQCERCVAEVKSKSLAQEAVQLRASLVANEQILERRRAERNEACASSLQLELILAQNGNISPAADHMISSLIALRVERDRLRTQLTLMDGNFFLNKDIGRTATDIEISDDSVDKYTTLLQKLTGITYVLQHEKEELKCILEGLQIKLVHLQVKKAQQMENIAMLEKSIADWIVADVGQEEVEEGSSIHRHRKPLLGRLLGNFRRYVS